MSIQLTKKESTFIEKFEITRVNKFNIKKSSKKYEILKDINVSKIGGIPYWPVSSTEQKDYPYIDNLPGKLLIQLNLNEISKTQNLKNISPYFPTEGILQFFISAQEKYSSLYNEENSTIIVYHKNIEKNNCLNDEQFNINLHNEDSLFSKSVRIDLEEDSELLGPQDEFYIERFKDLFTGNDEDIESFYHEYVEFQNNGSKVGGYSSFMDNDPYFSLVEEDKLILMVQLETDDNLGLSIDEGILNWRIFENDLKNLNFNDVLYYNG